MVVKNKSNDTVVVHIFRSTLTETQLAAVVSYHNVHDTINEHVLNYLTQASKKHKTNIQGNVGNGMLTCRAGRAECSNNCT